LARPLLGTQKGDPVKRITLLLSSVLAVVGCGTANPARGISAGTGGATGTGGAAGSGGVIGTGGGAPDGGQDLCSLFCATTLLCATQEKCTLVDPAAAASACTTACQHAAQPLTPAQVSTIAACYACLNALTPALCPRASFASCKSVCDDTAVNDAAYPFEQVLLKDPGAAALACTDGENLLLSHCSDGSSAGSCTLSCCTTAGCASPDVEAQCTVPDSGPIPCTCTAGKNKGKTFEVPNTPGFCGNLDVWPECNL
jgi:hypothetical protein